MYSSFYRTGNRYTVQTNISRSFIPVEMPRKGSSNGIVISLENGSSESDIWLGDCYLNLFSGPSNHRLNIMSKLFIRKLNSGTSPRKYNFFEEVNMASVIPGTVLPEPTSLNALVSRYTWDNVFLYKNTAISHNANFELVRDRAYRNILRAAQNVTDTDSASNLIKELIQDVHINIDLLAEVLAKALVIKGLSHVE